ncbi:cation:proton antiporter [Candidatus Pacearchaeota archaeon]|nr:cation:proton antiporter [Candidatus Pacearchaeota archaeon]
MALDSIFLNISLIIIIAMVVAAIMRILKQPLIMGYIITGIIVGPYFFNLLSASDAVGTFSKIGVALLLFTVGLHLNPKVIKEVGKVSLITGIGQVIFTSIIGFLIAYSLGFSFTASVYIAVALTFSSTIIIMKLLSDKGDLETVYGKIAIGFLIVQDLIAIFALMLISSLSVGVSASPLIVMTLLKGVLATIFLFGFSIYFLPSIIKVAARTQELLFLFSIAWCLALASLFSYMNFSLEIGALFAGVALSMSPYSTEISSKLKPLRDFFLILFFIFIGSQMVFGDVMNNSVSILIFSLVILVGNPLIVIALMGFLGYTKRSSFMAGMTVAQIGEFSIIMVALGITVGHLNQEILSIITMIGLITIAGSTYMISYSNKIYPIFSKYLNIFERKDIKEKKKINKNYDAILFGYNRIGFNILNVLKKIKKNYLVIDFNPETISTLSRFGIPSLYGDADDTEFLDELPLSKTKLIISTIPEAETNFLLIEKTRLKNKNAIIIVRAHSIKDAIDFYKKGATYVLTPHFLGGEYLAKMIEKSGVDKEDYKKEKEKHIEMLKEMSRTGKDHPEVSRN